jgi:orotidine-5'-phosphate decarboxylase
MLPADRIIVPLDVSTEVEAIALVDSLPEVTFWKVGLELFVSVGPSILSHLRERQTRIFLDLKFHDIPNTMVGACRAAAGYGVDLFTVHAAAGKEALSASQHAVEEQAALLGFDPPKLLGITLLTSLGSRALAFELGVPVELPEYVLKMAALAQESGLSGAVCSPQEIELLRRVCGDQFLLVCPGVRPQWAEAGDQQRRLTPSAALHAGANYLVIGRPITASDDPASAFRRICDEIA